MIAMRVYQLLPFWASVMAFPPMAPLHGRAGFDPASQLVSITGDHRFIAPTNTDFRGPCPGLNALANHGYIPRNGYVSIPDVISGGQAVYNFGPDFMTLLGVAGVYLGGDGQRFSIGAPPPISLLDTSLLNVATLLLGITPTGLSKSHDKLESDASPTRGDLFQYGDADAGQPRWMNQLLGTTGGQDPYNKENIADAAYYRHMNSINENPRYFRGPICVAFNTIAHLIIANGFANHSAAQPDGFLGQDHMTAFLGFSKASDGSIVYAPGHEHIPDNYYKRPTPWGLAQMVADLEAMNARHPELASMGGNMGANNSFTGVNIGDLTGGVYTAQSLTQGNNLACFLLQVFQITSVEHVNQSNMFLQPLVIANQIVSQLSSIIGPLGCPELAKYDESLFSVFPGWT